MPAEIPALCSANYAKLCAQNLSPKLTPQKPPKPETKLPGNSAISKQAVTMKKRRRYTLNKKKMFFGKYFKNTRKKNGVQFQLTPR